MVDAAPNWQEALARTLLPYRELGPPEWGRRDCMQFLREYYLQLTGSEVGGQYVYDDAESAAAIVEEVGGLAELVEEVIGPPHAGDPRPGDLVVVDLGVGGTFESGGVYNGYCVFCLHPERGMMRISPRRITAAWSV